MFDSFVGLFFGYSLKPIKIFHCRYGFRGTSCLVGIALYENPNMQLHFLKTSVEDFFTMAIRSTSWKTIIPYKVIIIKTPSLSDFKVWRIFPALFCAARSQLPHFHNIRYFAVFVCHEQQKRKESNLHISGSRPDALPFRHAPTVFVSIYPFSKQIQALFGCCIPGLRSFYTICSCRLFGFQTFPWIHN